MSLIDRRRNLTVDVAEKLRFQKEYDMSCNRNSQAATDFLAGSTPRFDARAEDAVEKALKDIGVKPPQPVTKYRSYFERQTAAALQQGKEITKASLAGYENVGARQKTNANLQPGSEGMEEMGAVSAPREGDVAKCARYCKQSGRTSCRNCHGEGYEAYTKRMGKSMHKARHFGKGGTELAPTLEK